MGVKVVVDLSKLVYFTMYGDFCYIKVVDRYKMVYFTMYCDFCYIFMMNLQHPNDKHWGVASAS